jgi:hypothetical protein
MTDEALRLALEALTVLLDEWTPARQAQLKGMEAVTAIKSALEANEFNPDWDTQAVLTEEIQRMAKRSEELEAHGEPVAFRLKSETVDYQVTCYSKEQADIYINDMGWQLIEVLYTTPPQRKPLTDEQIKQVMDDCDEGQEDAEYILAFARAIEAAHGIKGEA